MSTGPSVTLPFHSGDPRDPAVFHTNVECDYGKRITPASWRAGGGEYPACKECARLNETANRRSLLTEAIRRQGQAADRCDNAAR